MKKSILNIGDALSRSEQKQINGGVTDCSLQNDCEACGGFWNSSGPTCFGGPLVWGCCGL